MSVLHLQFTRPDGETELYHLKGVREYKIGRGSVCEIRILDMKMSRQHCQVLERDDGWYLEDLGSTNGARINGAKIEEPVRLVPGTEISVGLSELVVKNINHSLELDADDLIDDDMASPEVDVATAPDAARIETASIHARILSQDEIPEVENDVPIALEDSDWDAEPQKDHTGEMDAVEVAPLVAKAAAPPPATGSLLDEGDDPLLAAATPTAASGPEPEPEARSAATDQPKYTSTQHYIKLLGRRVGPLSRAEARRLKAKELKGDLSEADLDNLPSA